MSRTDVTCPDCQGEQQVVCLVDGVNRETGKRFGEQRIVNCPTCKGVGKIDITYAEQMAFGKRLRDERVAHRVGMTERAKQLGITPQVLSSIERGRFGDFSPEGKTIRVPIVLMEETL